MVFTSLNFLLFFPLVVILFYLTPAKFRWATLLILSFFFYVNVKPVYALLLVLIILSTYLFTRLISGTEDESKKKLFLISNIIIVLTPLLFFKYFSVINNEIMSILEARGLHWPLPEIKYMLPIGISFYTFMSIGYTIDIYNDELIAERHPGIVALFISFFPLILSGPIERAKNMIPQFRDFRPLKYENVIEGLKLMVWGYFMKLVVADRIGIYVDHVYANIQSFNGSSMLLASVFYPFQVYADLGGYSLIAIGVSRTMGIKVMDNFRRPFFATGMAEFWRRWHISLISWLTDYVYNPISFSLRRYKKLGIVLALMLTFLISGIWHGAALTFIVWGLMQGLFLSMEAVTKNSRIAFEKKYHLEKNAIYILICNGITFVLFASSQIFGRAEKINDAILVYRKIFTGPGTPYLDLTNLAYAFFALSILMIKDFKDEYEVKFFLDNSNKLLRYIKYIILIYIILLIGAFGGSESFIYFKF